MSSVRLFREHGFPISFASLDEQNLDVRTLLSVRDEGRADRPKQDGDVGRQVFANMPEARIVSERLKRLNQSVKHPVGHGFTEAFVYVGDDGEETCPGFGGEMVSGHLGPRLFCCSPFLKQSTKFFDDLFAVKKLPAVCLLEPFGKGLTQAVEML